jgi:putative ABC transport system permease protein
MTLKDIALKNLKRRKTKAAFVFIGLLVGVSSVVAFITLIEALTHDINTKLEQYGANILIVPKTENLSLNYGGMTIGGVMYEMQEIQQKELRKIRTIKNAANVAAVGPMVLGAVDVKGKKVLLAGMDFGEISMLRPWWIPKGQFPEKEQVLAGSEAARILGLSLGNMMETSGRALQVSGILEPTGSQDDQILFAPLQTAQTLLGKEGRISMAEVAALCHGCPIEDMVDQISQIMPGAQVMAIKQVVKGRMEALDHFRRVAYVLSGIVAFVGGLVVLVTMMGSVRERTAEIGIFRAIGFRKSHVMRIILLEAAIISALAGVSGYLLGLGATKAALPFFSDSQAISIPLDPMLAGGAFGLALFLGLLASMYPALLAARMDPQEALRAL